MDREPHPDIPDGQQLFDRQQVAEIVDGGN